MSKLTKQVIRLGDSIDYQNDSVVSKEIIKGTTGSTTVFAFDKGQGLSEHTAPFDALVYVIEGEPEIVISGSPFYPKAGDIIVMPANEPHSLKAIDRFKMMLVMIKS